MFKTLSTLTTTAAIAAATGISVFGAHTVLATAATPVHECGPSALSASLRAGSPGMEQRYATLRLKNVSRTACVTSGYVGMQLRNWHLRNHGLATDVVRTDRRDVHTVYLRPGESASTLLHWTVLSGANQCSTRATGLFVTPPNAYRSLYLNWNQGPVCHPAQIDVTPMTYAG